MCGFSKSRSLSLLLRCLIIQNAAYYDTRSISQLLQSITLQSMFYEPVSDNKALLLLQIYTGYFDSLEEVTDGLVVRAGVSVT